MGDTAVKSPHVYVAIAKVTAAMAQKGVPKDRENFQQKYRFRGIDNFFNALAPELAAAKLCILPRCLSREVVERKSASGNALFYITVAAEFVFVSGEDGTQHVVGPFYGEAMDSGDKATNKAMSAAYKYCVMQSFAIPVEGQAVDSEVDSHEVTPAASAPPVPLDLRSTTLPLLKDAAAKGEAELKKVWMRITEEQRTACRKDLDGLKIHAAAAK